MLTYFRPCVSALQQPISPWLLGLYSFIAGIITQLSFAPFHAPGLGLSGLVLLFYCLHAEYRRYLPVLIGFSYGLGFYGLGLSWLYPTLKSDVLSLQITYLLFIVIFLIFLSLYSVVLMQGYVWLNPKNSSKLQRALSFSALWVLLEYARAHFFTGFPWFLLGIGQIDSPLKSTIPIIGIYGSSFITCFIASCFFYALTAERAQKWRWLTAGSMLMLAPLLISNHHWTKESPDSLSIGIIQTNRDYSGSLDKAQILSTWHGYEEKIRALKDADLIVMPESAFPYQTNALSAAFRQFHDFLIQNHLAVLLGTYILHSNPERVLERYNTHITLGRAQGSYYKRHLVPFTEYIPAPFKSLARWLHVPDGHIIPGSAQQPLLSIHHHPVASLNCYEVAFDHLLRAQVPEAEWIVTLMNIGERKHPWLMYQELQMAQVRSLQTGRYQIASSNKGGSAVFNTLGEVVAQLPAFTEALLTATIKPATGSTPWVRFGDLPIMLLICGLLGMQISGCSYRFVRRMLLTRLSTQAAEVKA
ncbi:MAG: apolipoprotein N-acyltransferase [Legionellales bacterium]